MGTGQSSYFFRSGGGSSSTSGNLAVRSVTTTDSCNNSDDVLIFSGSSFTETLFTAVGNKGKVLYLQHGGTSLTQVYTLNTTSGQTVGGIASGSYALYTNGETLRIVSDGSNWQILSHATKTAPASWTPTCSWTTNVTASGLWWRDGHLMKGNCRLSASGTPGTASSDPSFTLPGSQTVNESNLLLTTTASINGLPGNGLITNGSGQAFNCGPYYISGDSTKIRAGQLQVVTTHTGTVYPSDVSIASTAPFSWVSTCSLVISFEVPITGWQP